MRDDLPDTLGEKDILRLMLEGKFAPMDDHERMGWAGIEYEAWVCHHNGYTIALDLGPGGIFGNVQAISGDSERLWTFELEIEKFGRAN